jgi:hypothetical protein
MNNPKEETMEASAELAGFFAAHAIWCVSEGDALTPMLCYVKQDGTKAMRKLEADSPEDAIAGARQWLIDNPDSATRAVLVYDGLINLPSGKTDAVVLEVCSFGDEPRSFGIAVPYRNVEDPRGFAIHRPKFLTFDGSAPSFDLLGAAFFRGVDQHLQGAEVWNARSDESH